MPPREIKCTVATHLDQLIIPLQRSTEDPFKTVRIRWRIDDKIYHSRPKEICQ